MVSSLTLDRLEAFEEVLALPGDLAGGDRSTKALISTLAAVAGCTASAYGKIGSYAPRGTTLFATFLSDGLSIRLVGIDLMIDKRPIYCPLIRMFVYGGKVVELREIKVQS